MRIVTVLTSKRLHGLHQEFKAEHVLALQRQLEKWAPFAEFECLTDVKVPGVSCRPLRHGWPGWWAKMELFDPELPGDFLYLDLDTVITGPIDDILRVCDLTLLRDFYRDGKKYKEGLGSGLMYIPNEARRDVWGLWRQQPQLNMRLYTTGGDQKLLEKFYLNIAKRWQDVVPGQVVSWKVNCKNDIVPPDARIVCFHGQPRPWAVGKFLDLYR